MAKIFLFCLLFLTAAGAETIVPLPGSSISATGVDLMNNETCDAPAPKNLQLLALNSEGATFSWDPVWTDASHTMFLALENNLGGWTDLSVIGPVQGNSYTYIGLPSGSYKVSVATNCPDGEPSSKTSFFFFKIIELTTGGRIPVDPSPVESCDNIDYLNHLWTGFRVTEKSSGRSNLFDVQVNGNEAHIRRVSNNQIVAVDEIGSFPSGNNIIKVSSPFEINDKSKEGNEARIGFVILKQNYIAGIPSLELCVDEANSLQWKEGYEFTPLISEKTTTTFPPGGNGGQEFTRKDVEFSISSVTSNTIQIYYNEFFPSSNEISYLLYDINGRQIYKQILDNADTELSFPIEFAPPGVYIIQIRSGQKIQTAKILKTR